MVMQALTAVIVGALASPVLSAVIARFERCNNCQRWEVAYWEMRKAAAQGETPPEPPV